MRHHDVVLYGTRRLQQVSSINTTHYSMDTLKIVSEENENSHDSIHSLRL
jgi:hypothetical protein